MNSKIIGGMLLLVVAILGFVFLGVIGQHHPETEQNQISGNTTNRYFNNSLVQVGYDSRDNILPENSSLPGHEKLFVNDNSHLLNYTTCKKYIYEASVGSLSNPTLTTYVKGIEEIDGKKYVVVESNVSVADTAFHKTTYSRSLPFIDKMFKNCPPKCEGADITSIPCGTITTEYIDMETGQAKVIGVQLGMRFKMENNTVYESFEPVLVPEWNEKEFFKNYKYNCTDYTRCPHLERLFNSLSSLHPLYVPGFINFEIHNISGTTNIRNITYKCSENEVIPKEIRNSKQSYNCSAIYTVNYIRKVDEKVVINDTYIESEQFYSTVKEGHNLNIKALLGHGTENLSFKGTEKINGREGYKIEYIDGALNMKYTIWIDKNDKILLGFKVVDLPYPSEIEGPTTEREGIKYVLIDEYNSCGNDTLP